MRKFLDSFEIADIILSRMNKYIQNNLSLNKISNCFFHNHLESQKEKLWASLGTYFFCTIFLQPTFVHSKIKVVGEFRYTYFSVFS